MKKLKGHNIDVVGQVFGSWTVLKRADKKYYLTCKCICGTVTDKTYYEVTKFTKKECGHFGVPKTPEQLEQVRKMATTHGMHKSSEYKSWRLMKDRCYLPSKDNYANYGGRGIIVCPEWKNSFEQFYKDMGPKPTAKHTLDRIDGGKNYSSENCKWSTVEEQLANRRNTFKVVYNGKEIALSILTNLHSIRLETVKGRLKRGWDLEKALTTPAQINGSWQTTKIKEK